MEESNNLTPSQTFFQEEVRYRTFKTCKSICTMNKNQLKGEAVHHTMFECLKYCTNKFKKSMEFVLSEQE